MIGAGAAVDRGLSWHGIEPRNGWLFDCVHCTIGINNHFYSYTARFTTQQLTP